MNTVPSNMTGKRRLAKLAQREDPYFVVPSRLAPARGKNVTCKALPIDFVVETATAEFHYSIASGIITKDIVKMTRRGSWPWIGDPVEIIEMPRICIPPEIALRTAPFEIRYDYAKAGDFVECTMKPVDVMWQLPTGVKHGVTVAHPAFQRELIRAVRRAGFAPVKKFGYGGYV